MACRGTRFLILLGRIDSDLLEHYGLSGKIRPSHRKRVDVAFMSRELRTCQRRRFIIAVYCFRLTGRAVAPGIRPTMHDARKREGVRLP